MFQWPAWANLDDSFALINTEDRFKHDLSPALFFVKLEQLYLAAASSYCGSYVIKH